LISLGTFENLPLPAGEHVLTLIFVQEGFNINQMQFILRTANDVDEKLHGSVIKQYQLHQNYPNPFFASQPAGGYQHRGLAETTISYLLPVEAQII
jgi:hypothetical protein